MLVADALGIKKARVNVKTHSVQWGRFGATTSIGAVVAYGAAAFAPLPDEVGRLLAFAFGPLLTLSFVGWYRFLAVRRDGPLLQSACLCGIIAGVLVTSMLVIQVGNNMIREEAIAPAASAEVELAARTAWQAVNRVQFLLDVVWDVFICMAMVLLGASFLRHPLFGKILGGTGMVVGFLLLVFNLASFPYPPAEAGSIDLGPLAALWVLVAAIRLLAVSGRVGDAKAVPEG